jgi:signal transduction histidine kinase
MGNIISLDELADRMLPAITSALNISQAKLLFQHIGSGDFTTEYSYPQKKTNTSDEQIFVHDNPIITWLRKETNPLNLRYIENISQFDGLWQPERDSLATSNIELLCSIKSRGDLIGILALGVKKGNKAYTQEDIEMIASVAGKAGIIIENARMFETLRQQQQQVQHLLTEAIQAQENERQRISADLHDSVAQWLAGASYQTQTVEALLQDTNGNNIRDQLNLVEETIDKSLTELRRVLVDLRPPSLDELGLSHSLHQSLTSISSDALVANFHEEGNHTRLEPSVEITVYRVVQEALNNIRKHAGATKVDLYLSYGDENVIVKIKDNGVGFNLTDTINNAISVGNLGLLGMKQRVDMLGGDLDIQTRQGKGTTITITLPLQPQIEDS